MTKDISNLKKEMSQLQRCKESEKATLEEIKSMLKEIQDKGCPQPQSLNMPNKSSFPMTDLDCSVLPKPFITPEFVLVVANKASVPKLSIYQAPNCSSYS